MRRSHELWALSTRSYFMFWALSMFWTVEFHGVNGKQREKFLWSSFSTEFGWGSISHNFSSGKRSPLTLFFYSLKLLTYLYIKFFFEIKLTKLELPLYETITLFNGWRFDSYEGIVRSNTLGFFILPFILRCFYWVTSISA